MKLLYFITLVSLSSTHQCPGMDFNTVSYDVEILKDGVKNIHQIVLNDNDKTLYFTFDQMTIPLSSGLGYFNLDDRTSGVIEGINNASGVTVDKNTNRVYVGGADGLYYLDENKVPEKLLPHDNIQYLFWKEVVYFINKEREAFEFDYGTAIPVPELQRAFQAVDKLIVDDAENIFFLKNRQMFSIKKGTRIINIHEKYLVSVLTTDYNHRPYIGTESGVFMYRNNALFKVANLVDLRHLIFTKEGDPIYVVLDSIVKLNVRSHASKMEYASYLKYLFLYILIILK